MSARRFAALLVALGCIASPLAAQVGEQGLMWRAGDPFVFCRYGMSHSPRAWYPVPDYARSTPLPTPGYCPWPTPYCQYLRGWSMEEIFAYTAYLRICPQAERSGRWEGAGDGTRAPFSH
ncbi:hypothetical protein AO715_10580 [Xanthomonas sp. Mitacek01]|nr:hypothetical protein AO715_10580 [Xanthomonas sp. Mitacek01]